MNAAIIVTSMRIPTQRVSDYLRWNAEQIRDAGAVLFVVCDQETATIGSDISPDDLAIRWLVYPEILKLFSITRTGNYGIRRAVEEGYEPIMKSDIDVCFLGDLPELLRVDNCRASVPKYGDCASYDARLEPRRVMPDGQGTVCLTAYNWRKVQGYDERFEGWGGDDNELCKRLQELGIAIDGSRSVAHIEHPTPGGVDWHSDGFNRKNWARNRTLTVRSPGSQPLWGIPLSE